MKSPRLLMQATKFLKNNVIKNSVYSSPAKPVLNRLPDNFVKFKFNTNGLVDRIYRANVFYKRLTGLEEREGLEKQLRTLQDKLHESKQKRIAYNIVLKDIKKRRASIEEEISSTSRHKDFEKFSELLKQELTLSAQQKNATAQYDSQFAEEANLTSAVSAAMASVSATELRRSDYFKILGTVAIILSFISSLFSYIFNWGDFRTSLKELQKDFEVLKQRNDAGSYWEFVKQSGKTFSTGSLAIVGWCGSRSMEASKFCWESFVYGTFWCGSKSIEAGKFCWGGFASSTSWCLSVVKTGGQGAYCGLNWVWKQTKGFVWGQEEKQESFVVKWSKKTFRGIKWVIWGE